MNLNARMMAVTGLAAILLAAVGTPVAGEQIMIQTVRVGNPGNLGEVSGNSVGGYNVQFEDRICGAVSYEYNIGKYEVTAGQYTAFLNAVAKTDTYGLYDTRMDYDAVNWNLGCNIKRTGTSGNYSYSVASDWANRPVNYVSYGDAFRFANWLHNGQPTGAQGLSTTEDGAYYLNGVTSDAALKAVTRKANWTWALPSEDEWYKAAYYDPNKPGGPGYWDYATRSDGGLQNQVINPDPGNSACFYDDPGIPYVPGTQTLGEPYIRTEVGEFENSSSAYGTFDQTGNVYEMNETVVFDLYNQVYMGNRGGSADDEPWWGQASYRLGNGVPSEGYFDGGFRVAQAVPEPGSIALPALGGVGMLLRRRGLRR